MSHPCNAHISPEWIWGLGRRNRSEEPAEKEEHQVEFEGSVGKQAQHEKSTKEAESQIGWRPISSAQISWVS